MLTPRGPFQRIPTGLGLADLTGGPLAPPDISGIRLYLDSRDGFGLEGFADGAAVSPWPDNSGDAGGPWDLSQGIVARRPLMVRSGNTTPNGSPSVFFDGASGANNGDFLERGDWFGINAAPNGFTWMYVLSSAVTNGAGNSGRHTISNLTPFCTGITPKFSNALPDYGYTNQSGTIVQFTFTPSIPLNSDWLCVMYHATPPTAAWPSTGGDILLFHGNTFKGGTNVWNVQVGTGGGPRIGSDGSVNSGWRGNLACAVYISRPITAVERLRLALWASLEFGVPFP